MLIFQLWKDIYFTKRRMSLLQHGKFQIFFLHYRSGSSWLFVTPFGLRKVLNWVKMTYNNIPVYITENGVSDRNGSLEDYSRVYFYRNYINEMLKGTKVKSKFHMLRVKNKLNYNSTISSCFVLLILRN